jgi:hypothetical protein
MLPHRSVFAGCLLVAVLFPPCILKVTCYDADLKPTGRDRPIPPRSIEAATKHGSSRPSSRELVRLPGPLERARIWQGWAPWEAFDQGGSRGNECCIYWDRCFESAAGCRAAARGTKPCVLPDPGGNREPRGTRAVDEPLGNCARGDGRPGSARGGVLGALAESPALLRTVDAIETDTVSLVIVQDFDS